MEKVYDHGVEEESKPKHKGWKAMPFVIGNETCEKLGTIGMGSNLIVYLTTVFNSKQVTAATLVNVWLGTTNLATLVGAFLCDAFFGRFFTIGFGSISSLLGMIMITLTAAIPSLHPPHCTNLVRDDCTGPNSIQLAMLLGGLSLMVIGSGAVRPCNIVFGADQFNPESESGKRAMASFFNWIYFASMVSVMLVVTVIIYIQSSVSWAIGFLIPTLLYLLSCVFFFAGTKIYVKVKPRGSPFTSLAQVVVASIKKRRLRQLAVENPEKELFDIVPTAFSLNTKLCYTHQFRFLNKAAIRKAEDKLNSDGFPCDSWSLCSIQQVEEMKCVLRVMPIWISAVFFYLGIANNSTYAILQAMKMDRRIGSPDHHFQIPAASFNVFGMLAAICWLPFYDRVLVPTLRRITRHETGITLLQRMGVGIVLGIIMLIISGLVEARRRSLASTSTMSGLWLIPQFVLSSLAEAFTMVGQMEFYYKEFPENMRSISAALLFLGMACADYISGLLVSVVHRTTGHGQLNWLAEDLNHGRLDLYYFMLASVSALNFGYFLVCAKWYKYKGDNSIMSKQSMEMMVKKEIAQDSKLPLV